jgi:hypothetical protein
MGFRNSFENPQILLLTYMNNLGKSGQHPIQFMIRL